MGMFDYVNYCDECPDCGEALKDFQSKDAECSLATVEPEEVRHFYALCKNCDRWIDYEVIPVGIKIRRH